MPIIKDRSLIHEDDISPDGKLWEICIKRTKPSGELTRLSDVFNQSPYGHIVKLETGMGATHLELIAERNSIVVEPLKITASAKAAKIPDSLYVGSSTDDRNAITDQEIKSYCDNATIKYKKIIVVADSLGKLIKILGSTIYSDYFLMIDEIDSFQLDSGFRDKMEDCIDIYKQFPEKNRALVSATKIDFSDPELKNEKRTEIFYEWFNQRPLNVICTNYVRATGYNKIIDLLNLYSGEKIMVAYNSVSGCRTLADKIVASGILPKEAITIFCSSGSQKEVMEYYRVLAGDILPARVCFFTAAYFSGFDLHESYHLVSLSSAQNPIHTLSADKLKQIAGRCRTTLLSETVIHDLVPGYDMHRKPYTLNELLSAAESEKAALQCVEGNFTANPLLAENLNTVREFIIKYATNNTVRLARKRSIPASEYAISYFNIDAYLEKEKVRVEQYRYPTYLSDAIKAQGNTVIYDEVTVKEDIKDDENSKRIKDEIIAEAITTIRESSVDILNQRLISKTVSRREKNLIKIYLAHKEYIDNEQLLVELEKAGSDLDSRRLMKLTQAMFYESLSKEHILKRTISYNLPLTMRFTGAELLVTWNKVIGEAGLNKMLKSKISAVRLTKVYFATSRQKKGNETIFLLKSYNPFKFKVIKYRITASDKELSHLLN